MIVVRFKVRCRPEKAEEVMAAFQELIAASRALEGVISYDIGRDLADPSSFFSVEVFEDQAALERQEALPQVGKMLALLEQSAPEAPEATVFHVASAQAWTA
jgi:quinol monooxygenase YgiN